MKALTVDENGGLSIQETRKPTYGSCQVLVKLESCGACNGMDTKLIRKTFKNFHGYPVILGYEGVGRVVEMGTQVESLYVRGLVLLPLLEERMDGCMPGWGVFTEYMVVGDTGSHICHNMGSGTERWSESYLAQSIIPPEDKMDTIGASMIITFWEVLSIIRRFDSQPNENALALGAGPVGLCFTKFLKLLGPRTVITADISDNKVVAAKEMRADHASNTSVCDIEVEVRNLFLGGIDYVMDAVGINTLINQVMGLIKYNGKICCCGTSPKPGMELDWNCAPYNWTLQFVRWPSKAEGGEAHTQIIPWINQGVLSPMDLISNVFDSEQILDVFALVEERKPTTKKIVTKLQEEKQIREGKLFCTLPDYVCTSDEMAVDKYGNLVSSCPNYAGKSLPGCVVKTDWEGSVTKWFDVPVHPETGAARNMGIALDEEWNIYLCDNQGWSEREELLFEGRILEITVDDEGIILKTTVVAEHMEHSSGIRIRDGYMYVTQSYPHPVKCPDGKLASCVYRFGLDEEGIQITSSLEDSHILVTFVTENPECQYGADGIVFDREGNLYIGNFGDGAVYRITFNGDGSLKENQPFAVNPKQFQSTDGTIFNKDGNLYIADFCANAVAKVTPNGTVERIAQSPDCHGADGGPDQPGEPIVWDGKAIISCLDLVTGPDKVNLKHEMPAVLVELSL